MWCIPKVTELFIERMEDILELYARPYNSKEPVLCFDEKSKQLLEETRIPLSMQEGKIRRRDYEYKRNGTRNIFVTVEPQAGYRTVRVTKRRTKKDCAKELKRIIALPRYKHVNKLHIVLDNLNTHFESSFIETFGEQQAKDILKKVVFHYTPAHASWLNMAEIEIGILSRQSICGRLSTETVLKKQITAWQKQRNKKKKIIDWQFTITDARLKFQYSKPAKLK